MAAEKMLKIHPRDNAVVALTLLPAGQPVSIDGTVYRPVTDIPAKQKFSIVDLPVGAEIIMYGGMVGQVREPIPLGGLLTTRNVAHASSGFTSKQRNVPWIPPDVSPWTGRRFAGYVRKDGQVGTRNYWIVIPLVFCENRNVEALRDAFEEELGYGRPKLYREQVRTLVQKHREAAGRWLPALQTRPSVSGSSRMSMGSGSWCIRVDAARRGRTRGLCVGCLQGTFIIPT